MWQLSILCTDGRSRRRDGRQATPVTQRRPAAMHTVAVIRYIARNCGNSSQLAFHVHAGYGVAPAGRTDCVPRSTGRLAVVSSEHSVVTTASF